MSVLLVARARLVTELVLAVLELLSRPPPRSSGCRLHCQEPCVSHVCDVPSGPRCLLAPDKSAALALRSGNSFPSAFGVSSASSKCIDPTLVNSAKGSLISEKDMEKESIASTKGDVIVPSSAQDTRPCAWRERKARAARAHAVLVPEQVAPQYVRL